MFKRSTRTAPLLELARSAGPALRDSGGACVFPGHVMLTSPAPHPTSAEVVTGFLRWTDGGVEVSSLTTPTGEMVSLATYSHLLSIADQLRHLGYTEGIACRWNWSIGAVELSLQGNAARLIAQFAPSTAETWETSSAQFVAWFVDGVRVLAVLPTEGE